MESSLHRSLKERLGPGSGGRAEVTLKGYRIDAIDGEGRLVEVQSALLSALRGKLRALLPDHPIRVVKPVVCARRVICRTKKDGADLSSRWSPKRGEILDVFDELVGLARLFPHPNLWIEVVGVHVDEIRAASTGRRRRWRERVFDRVLIEETGRTILHEPGDLWTLLGIDPFEAPFTTADLSARLGRSLAFAQRVAYCLRHSGAVEDAGKASRHRLYAHATPDRRKEANEAAYVYPG